jgi:chromosomal replication initiator protein
MARLQDALPAQQFNTWIKPLQAVVNGDHLELRAPNRFICDFVTDKYALLIQRVLEEVGAGAGVSSANAPRRPETTSLTLAIGTGATSPPARWEVRESTGTPADTARETIPPLSSARDDRGGDVPSPNGMPVLRGPSLSVVSGRLADPGEAENSAGTGI